MAQTIAHDHPDDDMYPAIDPQHAPAVGLFGYSIANGQITAFRPMAGYIREMEQMPNFRPPSVEAFVARYVSSNIGKTQSSS